MNGQETALSLYRQGNWRGALVSFQQALKEQPESLVALRGVASCYLQMAATDQALDAYRQAFALDPEDAETSYGLALTLVIQGHYAQALPYLEHSLQRQPGNVRAWSKKGLVQLQLGHYPEAESCLCKALELEPYDALDWSNLGVAYLAQGKLDRARPCFYKTLQLDPEFAPARAYLQRISAAMEWSFNPNTGVFSWNGRELAPYQRCELPAGGYDLEPGLELELEKQGDQVLRLRLRPAAGSDLSELRLRLLGPAHAWDRHDEHVLNWWGSVRIEQGALVISYGTLHLQDDGPLTEVPAALAFRPGSEELWVLLAGAVQRFRPGLEFDRPLEAVGSIRDFRFFGRGEQLVVVDDHSWQYYLGSPEGWRRQHLSPTVAWALVVRPKGVGLLTDQGLEWESLPSSLQSLEPDSETAEQTRLLVGCGLYGAAFARGQQLVYSNRHGSLEVMTPSPITCLLGGPHRLVSGHQDGRIRHWELPLGPESRAVHEEVLKHLQPVSILLRSEGHDRGGLVAITGDGTCYLPRGQRFKLPPGVPRAAALQRKARGIQLAVAVELPQGQSRLYRLHHQFGN